MYTSDNFAEDTPQHLPLSDRILSAALQVTASCHGRIATEAGELANLVRSADAALDVLSDDERALLVAVCEIVSWESQNLAAGSLDLAALPSAVIYADPVRNFLFRAHSLAVSGKMPLNPAAVWLAVVEEVARSRSRRSAVALVQSIDAGSTVEEVVTRFRAIEPPTARKGAVRRRGARTAAQVAEDEARISAGSAKMRFSSGYRTLDLWVTNPAADEPLGFLAPGEGVVVAAGTGQGKSSFSYGLVPSLAQDLRNWGLPDAKVYFAHTEEASADKVKAMRLGPGQRFHHLSNQVVVADVGSSREAFVMGLYDLVIDGYERQQATGRPITDFLPHIVVLDYVQALSGEKDKNEVEATRLTAELILRGVQAWNPEEMAKFGGVEFSTYAGMAWPKGMEDHKVASVAFAQLVKAAGEKGPFRPNAKNAQLSDYVALDANGDPLWDVKEGDQPVLGKDAIRGSGVILQNATFIIFLHRSNIHAGKSVGSDGRVHLTDTRARLIIDKMRNGALGPVVPMAFDSQLSGFRGQYFDPAAEAALSQGRFTADEAFKESGDPILPPRPAPRPLGAWRY
jgi:hypothetical protein